MIDLDTYQTWNPFFVEGAGTVEAGESLRLRMSPSGGKAVEFKPTVTEVEQATMLEWLGHVGFPGLSDGRHRFALSPIRSGTTLVHSEESTGILAPMLMKMLEEKTRGGFEAMNAALKERVEANAG